MATYTLKFNNTNADAVVMDLCRKDKEDGEWIIEDSVKLLCDEVPELLTDGDGFMSAKAYGILKLVQDRNSQLSMKALSDLGLTGKDAHLARLQAYKDTFDILTSGVYKAAPTRKGAGIDPIFAAAIAAIKGVDIATATIALNGLSKEARDGLRALPKVIEIMAELREEATKGAEGLLDDLLI